MKQILGVLAPLNLVALVAAFSAGWVSQAWGAAADGGPVYTVHLVLGLIAIHTSLAVHCLIFVYFLGTGRWVKEVASAYGIPDVPFPKLTRELKRRSFPPALFAMLISIGVGAAGAAAFWRDLHWSVHAATAVVALALNAWAHRIELRDVTINAGIIDDVMKEVDRIRAEHGLPPNAEALRQL
jgi:hypothetical protein